MNNTLNFHLTDEDMRDAQRYGEKCQLLCLLAIQTGTLWHLTPEGTALEIMAPYRHARFHMEVDGVRQTYQEGARLAPYVQAELGPLEGSVEEQLTQVLRSVNREFSQFSASSGNAG